MRSEEEEAEFIEDVSRDILGWCEQLVQKNTLNFKLVECKDKFMTIHERILGLACDLLCSRNKLCVDESSRRIIAYMIDASVVKPIKEKLEKEKEAQATLKAAQKATPKTVSVAAPKPPKQEKEKEVKPKPEMKKVKAPDSATASAPAPAAKKQKVDDTAGVKKIFSYFPVQSANKPQVAVSTAVQPSSSSSGAVCVQNNDENAKPKPHSVNTSSSNPQPSIFAAKPNPLPVKPMKVASPPPVRIVVPVEEAPQKPIKATMCAEMFNAISAIVRSEFEAGNNEVDISVLLEQAEGISEAQFQEGLEELQSKNFLMIVGPTVYEI